MTNTTVDNTGGWPKIIHPLNADHPLSQKILDNQQQKNYQVNNLIIYVKAVFTFFTPAMFLCFFIFLCF